jgi:hypothetical protein
MIKKKVYWNMTRGPFCAPTKPEDLKKPEKNYIDKEINILVRITLSDWDKSYGAVSPELFQIEFCDRVNKELEKLKAKGHLDLKVGFDFEEISDYYGGHEHNNHLVIFEIVERTRKNTYYASQLQHHNQYIEEYPKKLEEYNKELDEWMAWRDQELKKEAKRIEAEKKRKLKAAKKMLEDSGFKVEKDK